MSYLMYLLFVLLSFGQILRLSFLNQTVSIFPHEIVMGIILIFVLFTKGYSGKKSGNLNEILSLRSRMTIGLIALSFILSAFSFTFFQNIIAFLYLARLAYYCLFFIAIRKVDKTILKKSLMLFTYMTIFLCVAQFFLYDNLRNLYYLGWDPHQFRLFGTMFDTTVMGSILVMLFLWVTGEKKLRFQKILQAALLLLIMFTYSRITYMSLIVSCVYLFYKKENRSRIGTTLLLFVVALFLLPRPGGESVKLERLFSIESRITDNQEAAQMFIKHPILGIGYNHIRFVRNSKESKIPSHALSNYSSSLMTLLVTTGMVGFGAIAMWFYTEFKRNSRVGQAIMIAVIVASILDNVILQNFVMLLFLTIIAYCQTNRADR